MPAYKDAKRGTWFAKISVTQDEKSRQIVKRGFPTKKDALRWEAQQKTTKRSIKTFEEVFLEQARSIDSSPTAVSMKTAWLQKHFEGYYSPIDKLTKPYLIEWRNGLESKGLAVRTMNRGIGYVKSVLAYASAVYDIPNNGAVLRSYRQTKKNEMNVWTVQEFNRFLECVPEGYYKVFFLFLFWTGCRRGEALALQTSDIVGNRAHITKAIKHYKNGFIPLKTDSSERWITLDTGLLTALQPYMVGSFVFGGERSLPITQVQKIFTDAIEESGVKPIRIHDLRHSHATLLINSGANIVAVSKRLGHASITQSLRTYTHLLQEKDDELMGIIKALSGEEQR